MEVRAAVSPEDFATYDTERIRRAFLIDNLFVPDGIQLVYSHEDRIIVGGVLPRRPLSLVAGAALRADYFLQRREMGVINIGGPGTIGVDGREYTLDPRDGLYIGMDAREIVFASTDPGRPARFYFNSAPAHRAYPAALIPMAQARATSLGSADEANRRTIRKYIHPEDVASCSLVMGMTTLEPGSVWNTMPCHLHDRRTEVYLYVDLPDDAVVFHFMGNPGETRHIVVRNEQAVISPSWSIHSGVGTRHYSFIWGMAGENQEFSDMDAVAMTALR